MVELFLPMIMVDLQVILQGISICCLSLLLVTMDLRMLEQHILIFLMWCSFQELMRTRGKAMVESKTQHIPRDLDRLWYAVIAWGDEVFHNVHVVLQQYSSYVRPESLYSIILWLWFDEQSVKPTSKRITVKWAEGLSSSLFTTGAGISSYGSMTSFTEVHAFQVPMGCMSTETNKIMWMNY